MELKDNTNKTEERKNRFNGESVMLTKEEAIQPRVVGPLFVQRVYGSKVLIDIGIG